MTVSQILFMLFLEAKIFAVYATVTTEPSQGQ